MSKHVVGLTGASGYVAGPILQLLLEKGHTVRATVRSLKNEAKVKHLNLMKTEAKPGQLSLFEADLLKQKSFDEAFQGCDVVIHTASPFIISPKGDPEEIFIKPAVEGTKNVMQSCLDVKTVKRVVLTSSVVAIYGNANDDQGPGATVLKTEEMWNRTSDLKSGAYSLSKVKAEEAAWDFVKKGPGYGALDLVTINPGLVLGPSVSGLANEGSVEFIKNFLSGQMASGAPKLEFGVVDVRDVAQAHVAAMDQGTGRFICVAESKSMLEFTDMLSPEFSAYGLPKSTVPTWLLYLVGPLLGIRWSFIRGNVGHPLKFDNRKIKSELGIEFRDVSKGLKEMAQGLIDAGLVPKK